MAAPSFTPEDFAAVANMSAREAVLTACAELLGEAPSDLNKTFSELGADSLEMVELTMEVEERLLIELDDRDIGPEMTVADFIAVVERVRGKHPPAVCDEHDHRYEVGAYGVCRRCGGEYRAPTKPVRA